MIRFLDRLGFSRLASLDEVRSLTPTAFEHFTKFLMEREGYATVGVSRKRGRYHADGGVDLTAAREGHAVYVQCKRWLVSKRGGYMPIDQVRALGGVMKRDGVAEGLFVSKLPFGHASTVEASALNITLWGPEEISRLMRQINVRWGNGRRWSLLRLWLAVPREWTQTSEPLLWLLILFVLAALTSLL